MTRTIEVINTPPLRENGSSVYFNTLEGKEYRLPRTTYFHLKECKNRVVQKLDALVIITGSVGSGKSNKGKGVAGTWEEQFFNRPYTLDKVHFSAQAVSEQTDRDDNFTEVINFDEAIQGGSSSAGITKIGKVLRSKLITKRFKRHLIIATVDSLKELNDKLIERCVVWYHVYYKRLSNGKYSKGYFKAFSPEQALKVYEDLKDKRCRDTMKHPIFLRNKFEYRDPDYSNFWYSEAAYDKKKAYDTSEPDEEMLKLEPKHLYAYSLFKEGLTKVDISKKLNVTRHTSSDWIDRVQRIVETYGRGV